MNRIQALSSTLSANQTAGLKGNYAEQVTPPCYGSVLKTNWTGSNIMAGDIRTQNSYWRMMEL